jgi:hypothetical protein
MHTMTQQGTTMISYAGELAAFAGRNRIVYVGELADLEPTDPRRRFVHAMGVYAAHVASGELDGPYTDADAELFARTLLIPDELRDADLDDQALADELGVPVEQVAAARTR